MKSNAAVTVLIKYFFSFVLSSLVLHIFPTSLDIPTYPSSIDTETDIHNIPGSHSDSNIDHDSHT